ncbi:MAG: hypothetical protein IJV64_10905, partial [Oscillospiraceae bacterium]|nr:hypothetical protein [Oscillospiraceae bacterium]
MKRRILSILGAAVMLLCMACPAFAASDAQPQTTTGTEAAGETPPSPAVYPAEVRASEENGVARLEKVYYMTVR